MTEAGHASVDVLQGDTEPSTGPLRRRFLGEHTHAEDEVRFFVEGQELFSLHIGTEVLVTLCERGDLIRISGRHPPLVRHG